MTVELVSFQFGNATYSCIPGEEAALRRKLELATLESRRMFAAGPSIRGVKRIQFGPATLSGKARESAMARVAGNSVLVSIKQSDNIDQESGTMSKSSTVSGMKATEVAAELGFKGSPRVYQLVKDGRLRKLASGGIDPASVVEYAANRKPAGAPSNGKPKPSMAKRVAAKTAQVTGGRWQDASLTELVSELEAVKAEILRKIGA